MAMCLFAEKIVGKMNTLKHEVECSFGPGRIMGLSGYVMFRKISIRS